VKSSAALAPALREAAQLVSDVARGTSLAGEFERVEARLSGAERGALMDVTLGTLRRYGRVQRVARTLWRHRPNDAQVEALIWCSLYALESERYADYTVVDQAVQACELMGKRKVKGFVNAVLRGYLRARGAIDERIADDEEARYQYPAWWIDVLKTAYPSHWERVLRAGNDHPPMSLRVNRRRVSTSVYFERLRTEGIAARYAGNDALILERPVPVLTLPGFSDGDVSVQDLGAQRAALCLDLANGQRILDACAAPGGKSAHMLELVDAAVTAVERDAERCARMERNFRRLQLTARSLLADCIEIDAWWNGEQYDRILADVPCSASGVVRRHPDLKWLRRHSDLTGFAARQSAILDALWPLLAGGGKLLYVTCSVFPQENEEVVEAFGARAQGARRLPLPDDGAAQWLPGPEHDGFYYALIEKQA
jgi:16S rRNA (cytosine967-C5)-methyltransferase